MQQSLGSSKYHNSLPFASSDIDPEEWHVTLFVASNKVKNPPQINFLYLAEGEFSAPKGVERKTSYVRTEAIFDVPNSLIGPYLRNSNTQRQIPRLGFASYISLLDKVGLDYQDAVAQYFGTTPIVPKPSPRPFPRFLHEGSATWESFDFPTRDEQASLHRRRVILGVFDYEKLNNIHKNLRLRNEVWMSTLCVEKETLIPFLSDVQSNWTAPNFDSEEDLEMMRCCWNIDIW